jgi:hypothetical protein
MAGVIQEVQLRLSKASKEKTKKEARQAGQEIGAELNAGINAAKPTDPIVALRTAFLNTDMTVGQFRKSLTELGVTSRKVQNEMLAELEAQQRAIASAAEAEHRRAQQAIRDAIQVADARAEAARVEMYRVSRETGVGRTSVSGLNRDRSGPIIPPSGPAGLTPADIRARSKAIEELNIQFARGNLSTSAWEKGLSALGITSRDMQVEMQHLAKQANNVGTSMKAQYAPITGLANVAKNATTGGVGLLKGMLLGFGTAGVVTMLVNAGMDFIGRAIENMGGAALRGRRDVEALTKSLSAQAKQAFESSKAGAEYVRTASLLAEIEAKSALDRESRLPKILQSEITMNKLRETHRQATLNVARAEENLQAVSRATDEARARMLSNAIRAGDANAQITQAAIEGAKKWGAELERLKKLPLSEAVLAEMEHARNMIDSFSVESEPAKKARAAAEKAAREAAREAKEALREQAKALKDAAQAEEEYESAVLANIQAGRNYGDSLQRANVLIAQHQAAIDSGTLTYAEATEQQEKIDRLQGAIERSTRDVTDAEEDQIKTLIRLLGLEETRNDVMGLARERLKQEEFILSLMTDKTLPAYAAQLERVNALKKAIAGEDDQGERNRLSMNQLEGNPTERMEAWKQLTEREGQLREELERGNLTWAERNDRMSELQSILNALNSGDPLENLIRGFIDGGQTIGDVMTNMMTDLNQVQTMLGYIGTGSFSALIKGLRNLAIAQAIVNVAYAAQEHAHAIKELALAAGNPIFAGLHIASAAKHELASKAFLVSAAKWGGAGVGLAALSAAIGGGGSGAGGRATAEQEGSDKVPTEVNIYLDPFNPDDPLHQRAWADTESNVRERYGDNVNVNYKGRIPANG